MKKIPTKRPSPKNDTSRHAITLSSQSAYYLQKQIDKCEIFPIGLQRLVRSIVAWCTIQVSRPTVLLDQVMITQVDEICIQIWHKLHKLHKTSFLT